MVLAPERAPISSGAKKMAQAAPAYPSPPATKAAINDLAKPKLPPRNMKEARKHRGSPTPHKLAPIQLGDTQTTNTFQQNYQLDMEVSRGPSRQSAHSRPVSVSEGPEGFVRMLGSVSTCVRAVEKNVTELNDFLGTWVGAAALCIRLHALYITLEVLHPICNNLYIHATRGSGLCQDDFIR